MTMGEQQGKVNKIAVVKKCESELFLSNSYLLSRTTSSKIYIFC